jgi:hypothetical protein
MAWTYKPARNEVRFIKAFRPDLQTLPRRIDAFGALREREHSDPTERNMSKKFWLVTGTTAAQVEAATGLRAQETTHLGTLVEQPRPFNMGNALAQINRALNPNQCTCGSHAVVHHRNCPMWGIVT